MPILVSCDCGHEITVADKMEGKKGRCPKCDAIVTIPARLTSRPRRGGAFARVPRENTGPAHGSLSGLAAFLSISAWVLFLAFAFIGVYSAVTALMGPEEFHGPMGFFSEYADQVADSPSLMAVAFAAGGIVVGALVFLVLSATAQSLRLFISLERSLADITRSLGRND